MLTSFTEEKLRNLLVEHFPVIFVHLAISADNQRSLSRCLDFVKQHTAVDLGVMIKANRQRILTELLSCYNSHKTKITLALSQCALADPNFKKTVGSSHAAVGCLQSSKTNSNLRTCTGVVQSAQLQKQVKTVQI